MVVMCLRYYVVINSTAVGVLEDGEYVDIEEYNYDLYGRLGEDEYVPILGPHWTTEAILTVAMGVLGFLLLLGVAFGAFHLRRRHPLAWARWRRRLSCLAGLQGGTVERRRWKDVERTEDEREDSIPKRPGVVQRQGMVPHPGAAQPSSTGLANANFGARAGAEVERESEVELKNVVEVHRREDETQETLVDASRSDAGGESAVLPHILVEGAAGPVAYKGPGEPSKLQEEAPAVTRVESTLSHPTLARLVTSSPELHGELKSASPDL